MDGEHAGYENLVPDLPQSDRPGAQDTEPSKISQGLQGGDITTMAKPADMPQEGAVVDSASSETPPSEAPVGEMPPEASPAQEASPELSPEPTQHPRMLKFHRKFFAPTIFVVSSVKIFLQPSSVKSAAP